MTISLLKWVALFYVCQDVAYSNFSCRGDELSLKIKHRLVRDYGFDGDRLLDQLESSEFHHTYNPEMRDLIRKWSKYLDRLKTPSTEENKVE